MPPAASLHARGKQPVEQAARTVVYFAAFWIEFTDQLEQGCAGPRQNAQLVVLQIGQRFIDCLFRWKETGQVLAEHLNQYGLPRGQNLEWVVRRLHDPSELCVDFVLDQRAGGHQAYGAVGKQFEQSTQLRHALFQWHGRGFGLFYASSFHEACDGARTFQLHLVLPGRRHFGGRVVWRSLWLLEWGQLRCDQGPTANHAELGLAGVVLRICLGGFAMRGQPQSPGRICRSAARPGCWLVEGSA